MAEFEKQNSQLDTSSDDEDSSSSAVLDALDPSQISSQQLSPNAAEPAYENMGQAFPLVYEHQSSTSQWSLLQTVGFNSSGGGIARHHTITSPDLAGRGASAEAASYVGLGQSILPAQSTQQRLISLPPTHENITVSQRNVSNPLPSNALALSSTPHASTIGQLSAAMFGAGSEAAGFATSVTTTPPIATSSAMGPGGDQSYDPFIETDTGGFLAHFAALERQGNRQTGCNDRDQADDSEDARRRAGT